MTFLKPFFIMTVFSFLSSSVTAQVMITYADAKTSAAVYVDIGKPGDSVGDKWIFDQPLLDQQHRVIGNNSGFCIRAKVGDNSQCQWTLSINTDTIQVAGREFDKGRSVIAIIGGTGKYLGIQGELISIKQSDGTFKQTLNYSMPQLATRVDDLVNKVRKNGHYSCTECHGKTGNPPITDKYDKQSPILAGQKLHYLTKQLHDFKEGRRLTREMDNLLRDYSNKELILIAQYYADQVAHKSLLDPTIDTLKHSIEQDVLWVAKGAVIFNQGNSSKGLVACNTCHSRTANDTLAFYAPKLDGQHARYTRMTLKAYKNRSRITDQSFSSVMQKVSQQLSNEDIKHVSAYIQSLN